MEDALVLTIDHENPEYPNSCLVVSLYLINQMKNKLPPGKFKQIVIALGKYFNKEIEQEDFENKFKQLFGVHQKKNKSQTDTRTFSLSVAQTGRKREVV